MAIRKDMKKDDLLNNNKPVSRKITFETKTEGEDIKVGTESRKLSPKELEVNKSKKSKRGLGIFWTVYIGLVTFALIGFGVIWYVLWDFLNVYERSQIDHKIEAVVDDLNKGDLAVIWDNIEVTSSEYETKDKAKEYIEAYLAGENADSRWEFSKNLSEYTKTEPVYQLKLDGKKKALIYYSIDEKRGRFNTPKWKVKDVTILANPECGKNITVPKGAKVSVNGVELGKDYIVADDVANDNLGNVVKYIKAPTMTTYSVSGLYYEPEIKVKGPVYGSELALDDTKPATADNPYETLCFGFESDTNFSKTVEERITTITQQYGLYITGDAKFSSLSGYILSDSYAYSYLSKVAATNVWVGNHTKPTFSDMKVFNYQNFTDSCFACEVTFVESLTSGGVKYDYPTHLKYVFIMKNNKWYVADIVVKKA